MLSLSLSLSEPPGQTTAGAQVYRHHSARAACRLHGQVLHIDYSGAIGQRNFYRLDQALLPWRCCAPVALERMDRALTLTGGAPLDLSAWPRGTPPSVVIVRDDQLAMAQAFCALLAQREVIRIAFRQSQAAMALRLVNRLAGQL